jgi:hypothetical protein
MNVFVQGNGRGLLKLILQNMHEELKEAEDSQSEV